MGQRFSKVIIDVPELGDHDEYPTTDPASVLEARLDGLRRYMDVYQKRLTATLTFERISKHQALSIQFVLMKEKFNLRPLNPDEMNKLSNLRMTLEDRDSEKRAEGAAILGGSGVFITGSAVAAVFFGPPGVLVGLFAGVVAGVVIYVSMRVHNARGDTSVTFVMEPTKVVKEYKSEAKNTLMPLRQASHLEWDQKVEQKGEGKTSIMMNRRSYARQSPFIVDKCNIKNEEKKTVENDSKEEEDIDEESASFLLPPSIHARVPMRNSV